MFIYVKDIFYCMAYFDPVTGEMTGVSNTFLERFMRMVSDSGGFLKVLLPLLIFIGIFFVIKKYTKNKIILIGYSILAIVGYFLILWFFSLNFNYFYQ